MKKILFLLCFIVLDCSSNHSQSDLEKLCNYESKLKEPVSGNASCTTNELIVQLSKVEGRILYDSLLKAYCVITPIDQTYDCQFIGVLCDNYSVIAGKDIVYSAKFYTYKGSYKSPVGGQKIFTLSNFTYTVK